MGVLFVYVMNCIFCTLLNLSRFLVFWILLYLWDILVTFGIILSFLKVFGSILVNFGLFWLTSIWIQNGPFWRKLIHTYNDRSLNYKLFRTTQWATMRLKISETKFTETEMAMAGRNFLWQFVRYIPSR